MGDDIVFGAGGHAMTNAADMSQVIGRVMTASMHLWYAKQLATDGALDSPALVRMCMGYPVVRVFGPEELRAQLQLTKRAGL